MKSNDDKCHLIVCNQKYVSITLGRENIEESSSVELLGVNIDTNLNFNEHVTNFTNLNFNEHVTNFTNLNFNEHVTNLCKKANQNLHALARISKYLNEGGRGEVR